MLGYFILSLFTFAVANSFDASLLISRDSSSQNPKIVEITDNIPSTEFASDTLKFLASELEASTDENPSKILFLIEKSLPSNILSSENIASLTKDSQNATIYTQIATDTVHSFSSEVKSASYNNTINPNDVSLFCTSYTQSLCKEFRSALRVSSLPYNENESISSQPIIFLVFDEPQKQTPFVPHVDQAVAAINKFKPTAVVYTGNTIDNVHHNSLLFSPGIFMFIIVFLLIIIALSFSIWLSFCVQSPGDLDHQDNISQIVMASKHHKEN